MATRGEQANQLQSELRNAAHYVEERGRLLSEWATETASSGYAISPEVTAAIATSRTALEAAAKKIRNAAEDLEPFTIDIPPGKYADVV